MPHEIADSDAESDLDSPHRPSASPIPENIVEAPQSSTFDHDPFANLEFDQFLSPTQRLSSAIEQPDPLASRSFSSTDKFLREIAPSDHQHLDSTANTCGFDGSFDQASSATPRNKAKRTLTDIEGGQSKSKEDQDVQQRSVKRNKTYGSTRSQQSDANSLFSDKVDFSEHKELGPANASTPVLSETTSTELPVQPLVNPADLEQTRTSEERQTTSHSRTYQQHGATTFLQGNIKNTSITTSASGGYGGINLDFRGTGLGLDMSTNPFGSLSQVSLDGDIDPSQSERFASLFHHDRQSSSNIPTTNEVDAAVALQSSHFHEMATSPMEKVEQNQRSILSENHDPVQLSESIPPTLKKRGRKAKTSQAPANTAMSEVDVFEQLQSEDPLDLPEEQYQPRPSRSRAGTADSVGSHASQLSQVADISKLKRKRSAVPESLEDVSRKHVANELNLSDPAMIGAPKEMYVPRPSKSRSKRTKEDNDQNELHKEEQLSQIGKQATVARKQTPMNALESTPTTVIKKKPGRKSKVKRAKTSAAALLKAAEMYDEDDMDCIIVDEVPAKIKMGRLPEISPVKQEPKHDDNADKRRDSQEGTPSRSDHKNLDDPTTEMKISIDIPKVPRPDESEQTAPKPEPKKRGRKPKKKPEVHAQEIEEEPDDNAQPQNVAENPTIKSNSTRAALSEKDPNTTSPSKIQADSTKLSNPTLDPFSSNSPPNSQRPQSQSPPKPVHSPLKPKSTSTTIKSQLQPTTTPTNASATFSWTKPRVGLSRRLAIPSLLRKLDRTKGGPKVVERKEKLSKRQQEEEDKRKLEAEDAGEEYVGGRWEMRGKDGMLVEWDE